MAVVAGDGDVVDVELAASASSKAFLTSLMQLESPGDRLLEALGQEVVADVRLLAARRVVGEVGDHLRDVASPRP